MTTDSALNPPDFSVPQIRSIAFDYTSVESMSLLAQLIMDIEPEVFQPYCPQIAAAGLMQCDKTVMDAVALAQSRGVDLVHAWAVANAVTNGELFTDFQEDLATWVVFGHDSEDPSSAGGFNADEIGVLLGVIGGLHLTGKRGLEPKFPDIDYDAKVVRKQHQIGTFAALYGTNP